MSNNTQGKSARNTTIDRITEALDGAIEPGDPSRYLVSIGWDGRTTAQAVPDDASVMTIDQLLKAINEPNGRYIETSVLADFAIATLERLKGRDSRIGDMLKELAVTL